MLHVDLINIAYLIWHVECSSGAIRTACDIQIAGRRGAGWPKLTWKKLTKRDCCDWKLTTVDPSRKEHLEIRPGGYKT